MHLLVGTGCIHKSYAKFKQSSSVICLYTLIAGPIYTPQCLVDIYWSVVSYVHSSLSSNNSRCHLHHGFSSGPSQPACSYAPLLTSSSTSSFPGTPTCDHTCNTCTSLSHSQKRLGQPYCNCAFEFVTVNF